MRSLFLVVLVALFLISIPVAFALGITSTLLMAVSSTGVRFGIVIRKPSAAQAPYTPISCSGAKKVFFRRCGLPGFESMTKRKG